ncbi:hypothetical protein AVEN_48618-1 [Araneus ventricosus]|uniref:Uncharacterized protein n=1 Tax=Araneus ventricosus TaxID=182803 RepID=A0A4Y2IXX9_ARAVE|nr:hypothetical protein AVEN_48618-1 [Araneus ventricosus]
MVDITFGRSLMMSCCPQTQSQLLSMVIALWKVFDIVDGAPAVPSDVGGDVAYIWMLPSTTSFVILACSLARSHLLIRHGSHLSLQRIQLLGLSITSMCVE